MRRLFVLVTTASLLLGCSGRQAAGGGEDTNTCGGYVEYQALAQPVPTERAEVLEFAESFLRILRRVQVDERVSGRDGKPTDVTDDVVAAYRTLEDVMKVFRERARDAGDGAATNAAMAELTDSEAFAGADKTIAAFHAERCNAGYRAD